MNLTILLCDDHVVFRGGLALLLAQRPGWRVVAQAGDGGEALRLARELQPDVAVLDIAMPGMSGSEAATAIGEASPETRVVALSMYGDEHYRQRMFAAGASGYVLKNEAGAELIEAIRTVCLGGTFMSPSLSREELPQPQRCADLDLDLDLEQLTGRERDVLRLLAQGRRTRDIAQDLGISAKTVETYRGRVMLKLGIDNLVGLVKFAIRAGLVRPE